MAARKDTKSPASAGSMTAADVTYDGPCAIFRGRWDDLVDAGLVLPQWKPRGRRRISADDMQASPWGEWPDYDEPRCVDWSAVREWRLRLVAGGWELCVVASRTRLFLGGPIAPGAGERAAKRHIALVAARSDEAFGRFLAAAGFTTSTAAAS